MKVQFNLWLDGRNRQAGWLVQKIVFRCKIEDCENCPFDPKKSEPVKVVFFEAKRIRAAKQNERLGVSDLSGGQCVKNSCGVKFKTGEARFYYETVTGDLASKWKKGGKNLGEGRCIVNPGEKAIWTDVEPEWWANKKPVGRIGKRSTTLKWLCCDFDCGDPDDYCKISAKASPAPRKKRKSRK